MSVKHNIAKMKWIDFLHTSFIENGEVTLTSGRNTGISSSSVPCPISLTAPRHFDHLLIDPDDKLLGTKPFELNGTGFVVSSERLGERMLNLLMILERFIDREERTPCPTSLLVR